MFFVRIFVLENNFYYVIMRFECTGILGLNYFLSTILYSIL
jgi:hypothetical protein